MSGCRRDVIQFFIALILFQSPALGIMNIFELGQYIL
jgi:hypothetical protein